MQATMYGGTTRQVGREALLMLHGTAAYFDCTGAVIATDGTLTEDAVSVADKLSIRVMRIKHDNLTPTVSQAKHSDAFGDLWTRYIVPLAGRLLKRPDGSSNEIVSVDWSGVGRITSSGRRQFIPIEIFRFAIGRILLDGVVTRDGSGRAVGHQGGRYLWQLPESRQLGVAWRPHASPTMLENEMLRAFARRWGAYPFANIAGLRG